MTRHIVCNEQMCSIHIQAINNTLEGSEKNIAIPHFTNVDFAGDLDDRRSMSGWIHVQWLTYLMGLKEARPHH